ncbi:MAG TPA: hypothetical protein VN784_13905 [Candidatus Limnocylindrales bacterium]|nr:hypothetical protein [Candidatus Limnocylindrales bacterium]
MKTRIQNLLIALAILACIYHTNATTVFPIATNPSLVEISGGIAFDGSNYLVGMEAGTNVVGQLVSSNGALLGSQIIVGSNPGFPPSIGLAFGQTNYLLAWSDNSVSSGVDIFGQFVSRTGTKVGSTFNLLSSQGSHGFQSGKALASDGTNFLVVWQDENDNSLWGQLVTSAGTLSGAEFLINSQPQGGVSAAATFGKMNYLVVAQNNVSQNSNQVFGEFVSRSGAAGSSFQISQIASADQNPLTVAFDGTNYFVAWNWDPPPETSGTVTNWDIHGRLVSQTGTFPGSELALVTDPGSQVIPSLAFDGSNYLLSWGDESFNFSTNSNIRFQFFNRSGISIGSEFSVFTAQGTNDPLFAFNGLLFDGTRFAVAATLGTVATNANGISGFPSGEVFGAFIPKSTPAPQLTPLNYANGQFSLMLTGQAGTNYIIQVNTNLSVNNWIAVVTNTATNGTFSFTDTNATNKSRFYRAMQQ